MNIPDILLPKNARKYPKWASVAAVAEEAIPGNRAGSWTGAKTWTQVPAGLHLPFAVPKPPANHPK